jgi:catechol 2,3-dioxygenase-like lactoylglutathione lyase family enzyme
MFDTAAVMGFIPTTDFTRARAFYVDLLGLTLVSEDDFAIEVKSGGTHIRITEVGDLTPHPFTILGWRVDDIVAEVRELAAKGLAFERYSWAKQDEHGIWTAPGGAQVAWFRDPDGNTLSLSQHVSTEVE